MLRFPEGSSDGRGHEAGLRHDALKSCFRDVFGCRGREFGSLSRGVLGVSDGNEGVQWNAGYYPRDGAVWLGVNLEGMKYDDWPVARLIEREISRPLLLTRYRRKVARPDKVTVLWARDAWQYSARRRIKEANVASRRSPWIASMVYAGQRVAVIPETRYRQVQARSDQGRG